MLPVLLLARAAGKALTSAAEHVAQMEGQAACCTLLQ